MFFFSNFPENYYDDICNKFARHFSFILPFASALSRHRQINVAPPFSFGSETQAQCHPGQHRIQYHNFSTREVELIRARWANVFVFFIYSSFFRLYCHLPHPCLGTAKSMSRRPFVLAAKHQPSATQDSANSIYFVPPPYLLPFWSDKPRCVPF